VYIVLKKQLRVNSSLGQEPRARGNPCGRAPRHGGIQGRGPFCRVRDLVIEEIEPAGTRSVKSRPAPGSPGEPWGRCMHRAARINRKIKIPGTLSAAQKEPVKAFPEVDERRIK